MAYALAAELGATGVEVPRVAQGLMWEAALGVFPSWRPGRGTRLRSWLVMYVPSRMQRLVAERRRREEWPFVSLEALPGQAPELAVWPRVERNLELEAVRERVRAVPAEKLQALVAKLAYGGEARMAEELEVTPEAVRWRARLAREQLRRDRALEDLAAGGLEAQSGPPGGPF